MNKQIKTIKAYIEKYGERIKRDRGITKEIISFHEALNPSEFLEYNQKEYEYCYEALSEQLPVVFKEFLRNQYSRRLFFQFDSNKSRQDKEYGLICIESFSVLFTSELDYVIIMNTRSTDISKLESDIAIIRRICMSMFPEHNLRKIHLHCHNLHLYV